VNNRPSLNVGSPDKYRLSARDAPPEIKRHHALECLFKGRYIKRHRVWKQPDKTHAIVKDGKYVGIPGVGDHQRLQMAEASGATLSR
jgi:hypothetical protein